MTAWGLFAAAGMLAGIAGIALRRRRPGGEPTGRRSRPSLGR
jgi:hypothetical protein